jgi:hypothetical protein
MKVVDETEDPLRLRVDRGGALNAERVRPHAGPGEDCRDERENGDGDEVEHAVSCPAIAI